MTGETNPMFLAQVPAVLLNAHDMYLTCFAPSLACLILSYRLSLSLGNIWTPKEKPKVINDEEKIIFDIGEEYETALNDASEDQLVDLAGTTCSHSLLTLFDRGIYSLVYFPAILGLHSMLNQDQFHNTMLNKGQKVGAKFESIVKGYQPKALPMMPDNPTDVEATIKQVTGNDTSLADLNWNNIKVSITFFFTLCGIRNSVGACHVTFSSLLFFASVYLLRIFPIRRRDAVAALTTMVTTDSKNLPIFNHCQFYLSACLLCILPSH